MNIEFKLPCARTSGPRTLMVEPTLELGGRAPRLARLLELAHRLEGLVQSGEVEDYGNLARLGQVSPARISQIIVLVSLSPAIQEQILFLPADAPQFITELELRKIAREPRWDRQHQLFEHHRKK